MMICKPLEAKAGPTVAFDQTCPCWPLILKSTKGRVNAHESRVEFRAESDESTLTTIRRPSDAKAGPTMAFDQTCPCWPFILKSTKGRVNVHKIGVVF